MTFKFNFDTLRVLQVIDNDLACLLSTHSNSMAIGTKRDGSQRRSHFNFLDLLALDDIIEENAAI